MDIEILTMLILRSLLSTCSEEEPNSWRVKLADIERDIGAGNSFINMVEPSQLADPNGATSEMDFEWTDAFYSNLEMHVAVHNKTQGSTTSVQESRKLDCWLYKEQLQDGNCRDLLKDRWVTLIVRHHGHKSSFELWSQGPWGTVYGGSRIWKPVEFYDVVPERVMPVIAGIGIYNNHNIVSSRMVSMVDWFYYNPSVSSQIDIYKIGEDISKFRTYSYGSRYNLTNIYLQ